MSWPLLLAGYPRPILQGSLPLVVLALLERGGLVTEVHLMEQSGADERKLQEVLFDLRLNKLIEYGSHHLRLTERGREVINRFDLDKDVASNILELLRIKGKHREPFRLALDSYRRTAYKYYLNSLCSVWTWKDLAATTLRQETSDRSEEVIAGMRTLLTRDIDQWWKRVLIHNAASAFPMKVQAGCYTLSDTLKQWEESDGVAGSLARFSKVLETPHLELDGEAESKRAQQTPLVLIFFSFSKFRSTSEPDLWFDRWNDVRLRLPEPRRRQPVHSYALKIHELISERTEAARDSSSLYRIEPTFFSKAPSGTEDSFLTQLLIAQSFGDLEELTGLTRVELTKLLENIIDKCRALIEPEQNGKIYS